jgi:alpha-tubulin suppressor-like RCC1 family protein
MLPKNSPSSAAARVWKNSWSFPSLFMVSLLMALPAASHAATPCYSQGKSHTLTLAQDGKVWSLGGNYSGQLGNGTFDGEAVEPKVISGLDGVIAVLAGGDHSVALKKDGTVWAWGSNESGQLGNGTKQNSPVPRQVAGISNVKAIATGSSHIVALKSDGTVWSWGANHSGQIGNGENLDCPTPTQVSGLQDITGIVAGAYNTSALKNDGTVWSWGFNGMGQLGNGGNERSNTPVRVSGMNNVRVIAAGDRHVVALKQDGTVWAWGSNRASQLGSSTVSYSFSPVQVSGATNITDIAASAGHTIAIARNDTVWGWGDVGTGQWGNGASLDGSVSPVQVSGYNGPVTVAAVVNPNSVLRDRPDSPSLVADASISHSTISQLKRSELFITASR